MFPIRFRRAALAALFATCTVGAQAQSGLSEASAYHPNEKRFSNRIETVTVDSVFAWLNRSTLGGPVQVIR
jgi:hypothetical protein